MSLSFTMDFKEPCPLCGNHEIELVNKRSEDGTVIPSIYCPTCKIHFTVENNSPYISDMKTYEHLYKTLQKTWNTRKKND